MPHALGLKRGPRRANLLVGVFKRYQDKGHLHFITFSCYRRLPYLETDHARTTFLELLETTLTRHRCDLHGHVLMPGHVHLLLSEPKLHPLHASLRVLKTETSKHLKGTRPQFWQRRYYDFNVFTEAKRTEKLNYMHANPVRRDLVPYPADWPWSSYRSHTTHNPGCPLHTQPHRG